MEEILTKNFGVEVGGDECRIFPKGQRKRIIGRIENVVIDFELIENNIILDVYRYSKDKEIKTATVTIRNKDVTSIV